MRPSRGLLLYEDHPTYGLALKLIIIVIPGGLLAAAAGLWASGEHAGGLVLLAESFFLGLIFWSIFPRSYQVYEDRIRIALGGPFGIDLWFRRVEKVEYTGIAGLTMNFVTTFARRYVRIVTSTGMNTAITPKAPEDFVHNANEALQRWQKRNAQAA